jgi:hypothetical protein
VELFAAIRRDERVEGLSIRQLAEQHKVHRRTVRQALDIEAGKQPAAGFVPQTHAPGAEAEVDYADPRRDTSAEERPGATAAARTWNERYPRTRQV